MIHLLEISAALILCSYSEVLGDFMEGRGAVSPGILTLTTGLSKPFMRLDKYPTLLKELERHMEVCIEIAVCSSGVRLSINHLGLFLCRRVTPIGQTYRSAWQHLNTSL